MTKLVPIFSDRTPFVAALGERASYRFFEFLTGQIRITRITGLRGHVDCTPKLRHAN